MVTTNQARKVSKSVSTEIEAELLRSLEHVLGSPTSAVLSNPGGEEFELPSSLRSLMLEAVRQMSEGNLVTIVANGRDLTTQEAADLLNVSRPYLISLLEDGHIPFYNTGSHRRVALDDVLRFKQERDAATRETLKQLTRESQELGLYDL